MSRASLLVHEKNKIVWTEGFRLQNESDMILVVAS
jgi:hypothetical protein